MHDVSKGRDVYVVAQWTSGSLLGALQDPVTYGPCSPFPSSTASPSWRQSGLVCDELVARDICMDYNLVANHQVFEGCGCTALIKLGLVIHIYYYGFLCRVFNGNGTIGNAGDRTHDMLLFSVRKCHE